MSATLKTKQRNQSMEVCKLIASFFVVFIHAPFPLPWGPMVDCLATFAVPMFFMITGYFNYGADCAALKRRTVHIVKLLVIGTMVHILYACVVTELEGGSTIAYLRAAIPDPDEVVRWIVLHIHPYAGHLWYLNATIAVYLCFWGYTRFFGEKQVNYRGFYTLCLNLFVICFLFAVVEPAMDNEFPALSCRNGWFFGLPMFGIGLFLREHQQQIADAFRPTTGKLLAVIFGGAAFSLLQWYAVGIGLIPFGMLIMVPALMLLMASHPSVPVRRKWAVGFVNSCGALSTWIYIFHLMVCLAYDQYVKPVLAAARPELEPWLFPLVVLGVSFALAVCAVWVQKLGKHIRKK